MLSKLYLTWSILLVTSLLYGCAQRDAQRYDYSPGKKNSPSKLDSSRTTRRATPVRSSQSGIRGNVRFHFVKKGETLYSIAWQHGYDVRELASWNRIRWPYTIFPKQKLQVKPPKVVRKRSTSNQTRGQKGKNKKSRSSSSPARPIKSKSSQKKITWQWPTKGKVVGTFSARERGKKGLDIAGKKGQPVYSASGGQVVYSGDGLRGYGNLVIIKHNETYFSAYAHNQHLYVKEKEQVKKGQHIADMGSSEAQRVMLHFEVRRNGKPVDPKRYLPNRR